MIAHSYFSLFETLLRHTSSFNVCYGERNPLEDDKKLQLEDWKHTNPVFSMHFSIFFYKLVFFLVMVIIEMKRQQHKMTQMDKGGVMLWTPDREGKMECSVSATGWCIVRCQ